MYKVIIVDDEFMIRNGIERVIPWKNMDVTEVFQAGGGKEALEIIDREHPDIMITDISMAGMTGIELIEEAKRRQPNIKSIVLTGYDDFSYAHQCLKLHVIDFFLKPIDEEILTKSIELVIKELKDRDSNDKQQKRDRRTQGMKDQLTIGRILRDLVHKRTKTEGISILGKDYFFDVEQSLLVAIIETNLRVSNPDRDYRNLFVKNVSIDLFDARGVGITFDDDDGRLLLLLYVDKNDNTSQEQLKNFVNILKDEYDSHVKIILGSVVNGLKELYISYSDALLLYKNEKEGISEIIQNQNIEKRQSMYFGVIVELKQYMQLNIGDIDCINKVFDTFIKTIEAYNVSINQVKRSCFDIATDLYYGYINYTGKQTDEKLIQLLETINISSKEVACDATKQFITELFNIEKEQFDESIQTAKEYINNNLCEDLTVANLATMLFVTPNYLSRLFKKTTGIGCNEYIIKKRMDKAKALLENTSLKSGNIATMIGYKDTNYFSITFKKYNGISPTAYREMARK